MDSRSKLPQTPISYYESVEISPGILLDTAYDFYPGYYYSHSLFIKTQPNERSSIPPHKP